MAEINIDGEDALIERLLDPGFRGGERKTVEEFRRYPNKRPVDNYATLRSGDWVWYQRRDGGDFICAQVNRRTGRLEYDIFGTRISDVSEIWLEGAADDEDGGDSDVEEDDDDIVADNEDGGDSDVEEDDDDIVENNDGEEGVEEDAGDIAAPLFDYDSDDESVRTRPIRPGMDVSLQEDEEDDDEDEPQGTLRQKLVRVFRCLGTATAAAAALRPPSSRSSSRSSSRVSSPPYKKTRLRTGNTNVSNDNANVNHPAVDRGNDEAPQQVDDVAEAIADVEIQDQGDPQQDDDNQQRAFVIEEAVVDVELQGVDAPHRDDDAIQQEAPREFPDHFFLNPPLLNDQDAGVRIENKIYAPAGGWDVLLSFDNNGTERLRYDEMFWPRIKRSNQSYAMYHGQIQAHSHHVSRRSDCTAQILIAMADIPILGLSAGEGLLLSIRSDNRGAHMSDCGSLDPSRSHYPTNPPPSRIYIPFSQVFDRYNRDENPSIYSTIPNESLMNMVYWYKPSKVHVGKDYIIAMTNALCHCFYNYTLPGFHDNGPLDRNFMKVFFCMNESMYKERLHNGLFPLTKFKEMHLFRYDDVRTVNVIGGGGIEEPEDYQVRLYRRTNDNFLFLWEKILFEHGFTVIGGMMESNPGVQISDLDFADYPNEESNRLDQKLVERYIERCVDEIDWSEGDDLISTYDLFMVGRELRRIELTSEHFSRNERFLVFGIMYLTKQGRIPPLEESESIDWGAEEFFGRTYPPLPNRERALDANRLAAVMTGRVDNIQQGGIPRYCRRNRIYIKDGEFELDRQLTPGDVQKALLYLRGVAMQHIEDMRNNGQLV